MNDLAEEFAPDIIISERKIARWDEMLLKKYGIDKVAQGADKLFKTYKYNSFPKISDIIEAIEGKKDDIENIALESCLEAKGAILQYGIYENVSFDPIINKTIESLGGWQDFCTTPTEEWKWKQKDFIKNYCMFYQDAKSPDFKYPASLPGINNSYGKRINYIKTKYAVDTPKQIDEPQGPVKNVLKELKEKLKDQNT